MLNPMLGDVTINKDKVSVKLVISTGETLIGEIFVTPTQRLQDLLNGNRAFIPVHVLKPVESFQMINKSWIVSVEEV